MTENTKLPSFLRHEGRVGPADFTDPIHIIGCGAVGSNGALLLCNMGWQHFVFYDNDIVEDYNVSNQAFYARHIGMKKTEALKEVLLDVNPAVTVEIRDRFFSSELDGGIEGAVFIATDTMAARKDIFNVINMNPLITAVAEIRLGFDHGECAVLDPLDIVQLESWYNGLCNDEDVEEGPCNLRICTTLVWNKVSEAVQQITEFYAARRHGETWVHNPRLVTSFKNGIYHLKLGADVEPDVETLTIS